MEKGGHVYILANRRNGTLYIGVTSALLERMRQHREGLLPGFTADYDVKRLVWMEWHAEIGWAIRREKQLKKWNRAWKVRLIEERNPRWLDLAASELGLASLPSSGPKVG